MDGKTQPAYKFLGTHFFINGKQIPQPFDGELLPLTDLVDPHDQKGEDVIDVRVTDTFRFREKHPVTGQPAAHWAADLGAGAGRIKNHPLLAACDGIIFSRGLEAGHGYRTRIQCNGSYIVIGYSHMRNYNSDFPGKGLISAILRTGHRLWENYHDVNLTIGDKVKKGQVLGYSDETGTSTGPHTHITVEDTGSNGFVYDPVFFFANNKYFYEFNDHRDGDPKRRALFQAQIGMVNAQIQSYGENLETKVNQLQAQLDLEKPVSVNLVQNNTPPTRPAGERVSLTSLKGIIPDIHFSTIDPDRLLNFIESRPCKLGSTLWKPAGSAIKQACTYRTEEVKALTFAVEILLVGGLVTLAGGKLASPLLSFAALAWRRQRKHGQPEPESQTTANWGGTSYAMQPYIYVRPNYENTVENIQEFPSASTRRLNTMRLRRQEKACSQVDYTPQVSVGMQKPLVPQTITINGNTIALPAGQTVTAVTIKPDGTVKIKIDVASNWQAQEELKPIQPADLVPVGILATEHRALG